jgi:hypothetical protein
LSYASSEDFLLKNVCESIQSRVTIVNRRLGLQSSSKLSVYRLRKHYKEKGIKWKVTRESNTSINKYTPEEQLVKLKTLQQALLAAQSLDAIIYQIDESIFDAR